MYLVVNVTMCAIFCTYIILLCKSNRRSVILLMYTFLLDNLDADYAHEWFVGELWMIQCRKAVGICTLFWPFRKRRIQANSMRYPPSRSFCWWNTSTCRVSLRRAGLPVSIFTLVVHYVFFPRPPFSETSLFKRQGIRLVSSEENVIF